MYIHSSNTIAGENRHFKLTFDGVLFDATLVDLPTIVESQKTLDGFNFYKAADICQVWIYLFYICLNILAMCTREWAV